MSKTRGLIKMQGWFNRNQQKADWKLLIKLTGKNIKEPDWNLSVKKIDKYMEEVCKENSIDFAKQVEAQG